MEKAHGLAGPKVHEFDTLIPLTAFAKAMGFCAPLYTSQQTWEDVVRHGPYDLCRKLSSVVDNAVAGHRAEFAALLFTHRYQEEEGGKAKKVRLRVELFQTSEAYLWVMLTQVAGRSGSGRSRG